MDSPIGEVDQAAITLHEMYESFKRAGFKRGQAFILTCVAIHAQFIAACMKD